jgi:hypothetical protein
MTTLMLAFGIYIVGVAIVLYARPNLMFRENSWKEFGLGTNGIYTVFPFWLFTFVWAVISYALASVSNLYIAKLALLSVAPNTSHKFIDNIATPVSAAAPNPLPGYYIMQPQSVGQPQFVYFGTSPPTLANMRH